MKRFAVAFAVVVAFAIVAFAIVACSGSRSEGIDASKVPDDLRGDYQIFASRCSKCHSLARPISAGFTDDQQWVDYVNRMRRQPASGISHNDQAHILRFLKWYAGELRRKEEQKRAGDKPPPGPTPIPPPITTFVPDPPPLPDGGAQ